MIYIHVYTLRGYTKKEMRNYSKEKLRENAAHYLQQDPSEITFSYNSNGKPSTKNISFSVSHSHEKLVHVFTQSGDIGVDIEYKDQQRNYMKVVKRFFHQQEYKLLKTLNKVNSRDLFYDLWTAKEAVCKAQGGRLWSYMSDSYLNKENHMKDSFKDLDLMNVSGIKGYSLTLANDTNENKIQDVQTIYA